MSKLKDKFLLKSNEEKALWMLLTATAFLMLFFMICRLCGLLYFTNNYPEHDCSLILQQLILFILSFIEYWLFAMILSTAKWWICLIVALGYNCLLVIVTLFIFKSAYPFGFHTDKSIHCIILSYITIFICCCIGYVFKGQYISILLLTSAIAYANNKLGNMQYKADRFDVIKDPYNDLKEYYEFHTLFNVRTCTKEQLIDQCRFKGLTIDQTAFCIDAFIYLSEKDLWNKYGGEFQSVVNKKQYYRKILMDGRKVYENK